jgi:hypothetical protein
MSQQLSAGYNLWFYHSLLEQVIAGPFLQASDSRTKQSWLKRTQRQLKWGKASRRSSPGQVLSSGTVPGTGPLGKRTNTVTPTHQNSHPHVLLLRPLRHSFSSVERALFHGSSYNIASSVIGPLEKTVTREDLCLVEFTVLIMFGICGIFIMWWNCDKHWGHFTLFHFSTWTYIIKFSMFEITNKSIQWWAAYSRVHYLRVSLTVWDCSLHHCK